MGELLKLLGFTTPLMYAAAAYGLFHWLDENASDEAKAALTQTMRWKSYRSKQVASALVEVFDRIYTYPLFHLRAFLRSLIYTTVVSVIFLLLLAPQWVRDLYGYPEWIALTMETWAVAFLINVFTDYLSLFAIRPLLLRSGTKPVMSLALCGLIGAVIVLSANMVRWFFINWLFCFAVPFFCSDSTTKSAFEILKDHSLTDLSYALPAIVVFVWLPLFAFGIITARLLTPVSLIIEKTQWFLKGGKEHPLKAIGYVAAVVVFVSTVVGRAAFA